MTVAESFNWQSSKFFNKLYYFFLTFSYLTLYHQIFAIFGQKLTGFGTHLKENKFKEFKTYVTASLSIALRPSLSSYLIEFC